MGILFLIYRKDIINDFKNFINNKGKWFIKYIGIFLLSILLMGILNVILYTITNMEITKNEEKLDVIYNKYKENINKEYKFYIDNTNLLLKDSNDKLNQIYSYLDEDIQVDNSIFTYTKYIYIDLPTNLATYIEDNNMNSIIELNTLVQKLKTEISTLSSNNIKITTIYNKILKELSKS